MSKAHAIDLRGELWSWRDLQERYGLARSTQCYLRRRHGMPHIAISRRCVRYVPSEIEQWLRDRHKTAK